MSDRSAPKKGAAKAAPGLHNEEGVRPNHITPGHVRAFQAVTSNMYDNITLWSCRINDEPGVAIVMVDHVGEGKVGVMPLFVAITESMRLDFDDEESISDGGSSGGPNRTEVAREFEANKVVLTP